MDRSGSRGLKGMTAARFAPWLALVDRFGSAGSTEEVRALLARKDLDAGSFWEDLDGPIDPPELAAPET